MQILVNFDIEGTCIRQSLPDTILLILLSRFLLSDLNGSAYEIDIVLTGFQKIGKNTRGRLELLNSIYLAHLLLVGFVALRPKSTAMVIAGRSVHLTTLFPGQA